MMMRNELTVPVGRRPPPRADLQPVGAPGRPPPPHPRHLLANPTAIEFAIVVPGCNSPSCKTVALDRNNNISTPASFSPLAVLRSADGSAESTPWNQGLDVPMFHLSSKWNTEPRALLLANARSNAVADLRLSIVLASLGLAREGIYA